MKRKPKTSGTSSISDVKNLIVVSDLHCGCRMGLIPSTAKPLLLDGGILISQSSFQQYLWNLWAEFWNVWVPHVTKGEPWILVVNGDVIDGVHHGSTTQISHNLADQAAIAEAVLEPIVARAHSYFHIAGTEAHVGKSAADEERIAKNLGAIPDATGRHARWQLWHDMTGEDGKPRRVHFTHHISASGSSSGQMAALGRELVEMYVECGKWGKQGADVIVRGHRHMAAQVAEYGARGLQICAVTPGWQGKTPFGYKISGRMRSPQFGGMLVRVGDEGLFVRQKVWTLED